MSAAFTRVLLGIKTLFVTGDDAEPVLEFPCAAVSDRCGGSDALA